MVTGETDEKRKKGKARSAKQGQDSIKVTCRVSVRFWEYRTFWLIRCDRESKGGCDDGPETAPKEKERKVGWEARRVKGQAT